MEKLHPGAKWSFRIGAYMVTLVLAVVLTSVLGNMLRVFFAARKMQAGESLSIGFSFIPLIIGVVIAIIVSEIYARLAYNNWRYEFTDMNLKLERGVIWKKYSNIPYERVQNVDISRGIFARMLGFSTVDIQTAGAAYSARGRPRSEGHIPAVGVERAEKIREFVMHKVSKKSAGGM